MILAANGHRAGRLPLSVGWGIEVGERDRSIVVVTRPGVNATAYSQDSAVWQQRGGEERPRDGHLANRRPLAC